MDPTKLLEADHRDVEDLFDRIEKAEGADRAPLIEELATSLQAHMALEEEVVYPKMAPATGAEAVEEGETEHQLARKALGDVIDLGPDEPGFGAALDALKAGITHHVEEEESDEFPKLRNDAPEVLEEMATPFMKRRLELGLPMTAAALADASTKEELLEEAKQAGIEGASSMDKAALAEALAKMMASAS